MSDVDWAQMVLTLYDSRDIRLAHPKWLEIWPRLKEDFGLETGLQLEISCVWRSAKAQIDLFAFGRTKPGSKLTFKDGVKELSNHQLCPSPAIDVFVMASKKAVWDTKAYEPLGPLAEKYGLLWGGNWKEFKDYPHLEIKSI